MTEYRMPAILALTSVLGTMLFVGVDSFVHEPTIPTIDYEFMKWLVVTCVVGPAGYMTSREIVKHRWGKKNATV